MIALATALAFWWTNALVAGPRESTSTLAMLPLDDIGSVACSHATRELVAAGAGAADTATDEQRDEWDRAAAAVLRACGPA
jgi:hypothetical protein